MTIIPNNPAPGSPGGRSRWTSSAKTGVGTSINPQSQIWFTLSHGIVNEVYYPRLDQANIRDFGLIVTNGKDYFSQEKRHAKSETKMVAPGVPAYEIINTANDGRYKIHKTIFTDSRRPTLLQRIRFEPLTGKLEDYQLFALLAPHLFNQGAGNDAWLGFYKGWPMAYAWRNGTALAMACSIPWRAASCGYVGVSDGWQDLNANKRLTAQYSEAHAGNVALTGEIDLAAGKGECVISMAFGRDADEASQHARASLLDSFDTLQKEYVNGWENFHKNCEDLALPCKEAKDFYRISTAVVKVHQSKHFIGGIIASLSIPWGFSKGDNDLGGYHLIWPRDQVESAGAILASGDIQSAQDVMRYLLPTQEADGHWPQNMWLDGSGYWEGVQLDESAFPILLAYGLKRRNALDGLEVWPAVRRAACYIVANGPVTKQDRWEEDGGYSPFTLAAVITGLLAAADFADQAKEAALAIYLRETADCWNSQIERWIYVTGTPLAQEVKVDGYYVRISPPDTAEGSVPSQGFVPIKNRPPGDSQMAASLLVSPDALALVRFGLRAADDPRIVNTIKVIDAHLKNDSATGPLWHRYNDDGYGEHADGSPFDGTGIGRGWPLLAGERAHYELAAGRKDEADRLRKVMEAQAGSGGFFPEQVWDSPDVPERELTNGHPSGSAMPLVWAHAEYIKLLRSLRDGKVFDMPPFTVQRYLVDKIESPLFPWRFTQKSASMPVNKTLRLETFAAAKIHWSADGWKTAQDLDTRDTGTGVHLADLPTAAFAVGTKIVFTFFWTQAARWENQDFTVEIK